jgi:hypothetical protein
MNDAFGPLVDSPVEVASQLEVDGKRSECVKVRGGGGGGGGGGKGWG